MGSENNPISQTLTAAFLQGLGALNWHEGGNLRIDWRWAGGDLGLFERYATKLVGLDPDVLVANGSKAVEALRRRTSTIPIIFVVVTDPVGQGFVESLAHPAARSPASPITTRRWPANGWRC